MASTFEQVKFAGFATYLSIVSEATASHYRETYERNRHRIYSLAFWMTDSELEADEVTGDTFRRAFACSTRPDAEAIDRALVAELRKQMRIGPLTLKCAETREIHTVRRNTMRVDLELAVVQLPPTERLVFLMHDVERFEHPRICRNLGISEKESITALHQARLRMRELLASAAASRRKAA